MSDSEYDDILKEMNDIESNVTIDDNKIVVFKPNIELAPKAYDTQDHKLDLILNEMKNLQLQVKELQEVVKIQTEHLENIETNVNETNQITHGTYKKLDEINKGSFYNTLAEFTYPILGSVGLGGVGLAVSSANKFNKLYKMWK